MKRIKNILSSLIMLGIAFGMCGYALATTVGNPLQNDSSNVMGNDGSYYNTPLSDGTLININETCNETGNETDNSITVGTSGFRPSSFDSRRYRFL